MSFAFRCFYAAFFAAAAAQAASFIGLDALGISGHPSNAAMVRNGAAAVNPAANAFEAKTRFGTTVLFEYAGASGDEGSVSGYSFSAPSVSMVLPMGFLGAMGIGLEQRFIGSGRMELEDKALDADVSFSGRAGIYELAPSYSLRLPGFLSDLALGVSYRIFFGNSFYSLERGMSESWGEDAWMARSVRVTEREEGIFEMKGDWRRRFGGGLHFHGRSADWFASAFPSVDMAKSGRRYVQFSNSDTLQSRRFDERFSLPMTFASGAHFLFLRNQNLSFVFEERRWEDGDFFEARLARSYFAEYRLGGTGLYYSSFFQRNNFGVRAWRSEMYLRGAVESGGSLFSDLWIGRRGTLASVALFGGYRSSRDYWDELFFGASLNLSGVGNWGTSSRRR